MCLDLFMQYAAVCSFLHKHLQFTKKNERCILHPYQAPQNFTDYCLPQDSCSYAQAVIYANIVTFPNRLWHESFLAHMRFRYAAYCLLVLDQSTQSSKCIISVYNAVNIKCHNVLVHLNTQMDINSRGFCALLWWNCIMCNDISTFVWESLHHMHRW